MIEFTYRSARSGSLVVGLGIAIVVEMVVLHLWLVAGHTVLAWALTLTSLATLAWLTADYRALGRGAVRLDDPGAFVAALAPEVIRHERDCESESRRSLPLPPRMSTPTTLILPGLYNSGPEHWQSYWERIDPTCRRVEQVDWETPRCADWVATIDAAIVAANGPVVLVAHSSSCAAVAYWARTAPATHLARVRGALLVAPSDPEGPRYPVGPTGFAPMPLDRLPFRTIVVSSADDEYVTPAQARAYAAAWGSELVEIGNAGHINSASGLGAWPIGYSLLELLRG